MARIILILSIFLCTPFVSQGQRVKYNIDTTKIWELPQEIKERKIPEDWKKESAIYLYRKSQNIYLSQPRKHFTIIRTRVLINDASALSSFSTFQYRNKDKNVFIRVEKKDGKIDEQNVVGVKQKISSNSYYYNNTVLSKKYAIKNLEVGDIIDRVEIYSYNSFSRGLIEGKSYPLAFDYPILYQEIDIAGSRDLYYNFQAPKNYKPIRAKSSQIRKIFEGKVKLTRMMRYKIIDSIRPALKEEWFTYFTRDLNLIQFRVASFKNQKRALRSSLPFDRPGRLTQSYLKEKDIAKFIRSDFSFESYFVMTWFSFQYYRSPKDIEMGSIVKAIKSLPNFRQLSAIEKARKAEEHIRYNTLYKPYFTEKGIDYYGKIGNTAVSDNQYTYVLAQTLRKLKIDFDIVKCAPKNKQLKTLFFQRDFNTILSIKIGNHREYFIPSRFYGSSNSIPPSYQGAQALAFPYILNPYKLTGDTIYLPIDQEFKNTVSSQQLVSLNFKNNSTSVRSTKKWTGLLKSKASENYIRATDFLPYVKKQFQYTQQKRRSRKSKADKDKDKILLRRRLKENKELLEQNFNVLSYKKFDLKSIGANNDSALIVSENFTLNRLIHHAGTDFIFDIGQLIGRQITLDNEDSIRTTEGSLPYEKRYLNRIEVTIPKGYEVINYQDLAIHFKSEVGAFISKAEIEKNKLIVTTTKSYQERTFADSDWDDMMKMLNSADEFTRKKIIFRKIESIN